MSNNDIYRIKLSQNNCRKCLNYRIRAERAEQKNIYDVDSLNASINDLRNKYEEISNKIKMSQEIFRILCDDIVIIKRRINGQ